MRLVMASSGCGRKKASVTLSVRKVINSDVEESRAEEEPAIPTGYPLPFDPKQLLVPCLHKIMSDSYLF